MPQGKSRASELAGSLPPTLYDAPMWGAPSALYDAPMVGADPWLPVQVFRTCLTPLYDCPLYCDVRGSANYGVRFLPPTGSMLQTCQSGRGLTTDLGFANLRCK